MSRTFCYRCATKLEDKTDRSWFCSNCDYTQYDNPRPAVEVALFNKKGKLLVSRRAMDPGKRKFDFPGGFLEFNETLEDGLYRELNEETGLDKADVSRLEYLKSFHVRYDWPPEKYHVSVVIFVAQLKAGKQVVPNDDSEELIWISEDEVESIDWSQPVIGSNAKEAFSFKPGL